MAANVLLDEKYRGGLEQTCRKCTKPGNEALRERWGCDAPAPEPWDAVLCVTCGGGRDTDPECVDCDGTGELELRRCPWKMIGWRERFVVEAVVRAEAGDRPYARVGWAEMPASFHDAFNVVANERAVIQERQMERERGKG